MMTSDWIGLSVLLTNPSPSPSMGDRATTDLIRHTDLTVAEHPDSLTTDYLRRRRKVRNSKNAVHSSDIYLFHFHRN